MLNRRYLRIKVFQQLYSFFLSPGADINRTEMELFKSLEKIYELYLWLLLLLVEIKNNAKKNLEISKSKHFAAKEELYTKFIENRAIIQIEGNNRFRKYIENRKINWNEEDEFTQKIFLLIKKSPEYSKYISSYQNDFESDKKFILEIYKNYIFNSENLHSFFEEKNIHWEDDITLANLSVIKTIEHLREGISKDESILLPLYKEELDDTEFAKNLLRKTILQNEEFEKLIDEKATNWEIERIAVADKILMKMALCELMNFENIPVKVSLNEYIEISKDYSTPQSKTFINGILDKLVADLKPEGKIIKTGRGLME